jgi:hypothetical protein
MALKNGTLNPLNVLGFRHVNWIPKHFHTVYVELGCDAPTIKRWIFNNLNSRFGVEIELMVTENNHMTESVKIGFEDPREMTLFMLTCPYLENRRIK